MLIHLTKRTDDLIKILGDSRIRANTAFGAAHNVSALAASQTVACFSELAALDSVAALARRHGQFGLGFPKEWMQQVGAAPVWYLPRDSAVQTEFFNIIRKLAFRRSPDPEHPLWRITPFIDYPRDPEPDESARTYDWRWEREWRIRGGLSFEPHDVALLFAPEERHDWLTDWWKTTVVGPWDGYLPSVVDAQWPRDRQEAVIRQGPTWAEIEFPVPAEPWQGEIDTAPTTEVPSDWDEDERRQLRAEMREELNGWLDEMARDDI